MIFIVAAQRSEELDKPATVIRYPIEQNFVLERLGDELHKFAPDVFPCSLPGDWSVRRTSMTQYGDNNPWALTTVIELSFDRPDWDESDVRRLDAALVAISTDEWEFFAMAQEETIPWDEAGANDATGTPSDDVGVA